MDRIYRDCELCRSSADRTGERRAPFELTSLSFSEACARAAELSQRWGCEFFVSKLNVETEGFAYEVTLNEACIYRRLPRGVANLHCEPYEADGSERVVYYRQFLTVEEALLSAADVAQTVGKDTWLEWAYGWGFVSYEDCYDMRCEPCTDEDLTVEQLADQNEARRRACKLERDLGGPNDWLARGRAGRWTDGFGE